MVYVTVLIQGEGPCRRDVTNAVCGAGGRVLEYVPNYSGHGIDRVHLAIPREAETVLLVALGTTRKRVLRYEAVAGENDSRPGARINTPSDARKEKAMSPKIKTRKVYAAYYQQRNGCDVVRVFESEASMRAWRDDLAREGWRHLFDHQPCPEVPGERYFERAAELGYETFFVEYVEVEP